MPLKYLYNFWKTLKMPSINCEINLILTWSANDTKRYVPVVNLPTQEYSKLLELQLQLRFKRTSNWNKYQSKVTTALKSISRLLH